MQTPTMNNNVGYIYILKSLKDDKNYIGSSNNLDRRIREHQSGLVKSTRSRRPILLIAYRVVDDLTHAPLLEKEYKRSHDKLRRHLERGLFNIIDPEKL
ncbi:GIY-YIG nuclease family protein [Candidatus Uhrbacteria bacterium]|nr:GIY-YIG nuclease family protein [Candidatus Uhrbacteria bacterium]